MIGQRERISAVVSSGGKISGFDGHRIAVFAFVDMGDVNQTTKVAALVDGELTNGDVYMILEQLYRRVGLDRFTEAAGELALAISKDEQGGATA